MIRKKIRKISLKPPSLFSGLFKMSLFIFLLFSLCIGGDIFAQSPSPPPGKVPSVKATEVEEAGKALPSFKPGSDEPARRPNHPPIDQIPPYKSLVTFVF